MPIQNALTAVMKLKPDDGNYKPREELKRLIDASEGLVQGALQRLGFVHFARFVFFKFGDQQCFAIITSYDFDFDDYINVFIDELGELFDRMLRHVDAPKNIQDFIQKNESVRQHRQEFIEYVRSVDAANENCETARQVLFYSAYPSLSVQHIWKLEKEVYA